MRQLDGKMLQRLRRVKGLTREELAAELRDRGLKASPLKIGTWERQSAQLTIAVISVLAEILEVEFDALVRKKRRRC